jgi:hypothetical protein
MAANLAALAAFLSSPPASPKLVSPEILLEAFLSSLLPNRSARDFNFLACSGLPFTSAVAFDEEPLVSLVGIPNLSARRFRFSDFSVFAAIFAATLSDFVMKTG